MLHKLSNDGADLSPNDPEKQSTLYEKYKQYQIPVSIIRNFLVDYLGKSIPQKEEIDWIGLLPDEALDKLEKEDDETYEQSVRPWKEMFRQSLITELSRRQRNNEPIDLTPATAKSQGDRFLTDEFYLRFVVLFQKTKNIEG